MKIQTILGAGGIIARALAAELEPHGPVRLVSRHPKPAGPGSHTVAADLNDRDAVARAVAGSGTVYLTAGLPYRLDIWRREWPQIMENVIAACRAAEARLIFFDNIYAYGLVSGPISEEQPERPSSKKGEVRKALADRLREAWASGEIRGAIVRAADFYGPRAGKAPFNIMVLDKLLDRKRPMWMCNDNVRYSMTFTPDAARGTALIGRAPEDCMNQVWHLPTSHEPVTVRSLTAKAAALLGRQAKPMVLPRWMLSLTGIFEPDIKSLVEMTYHYSHDYIFDSTRFEERFGMKATPYAEGLRLALEGTAQ